MSAIKKNSESWNFTPIKYENLVFLSRNIRQGSVVGDDLEVSNLRKNQPRYSDLVIILD